MKKIIFIICLISILNKFTLCVTVTSGNKISKQEKEYIKTRKPLTKAATRLIINSTDKTLKLPKISLCFSGGGYRAMIASLGFLNAAEEHNLLQASSYISTLSGSTWLLIPLLIKNMLPISYKTLLEQEINLNFFNPESLNLDAIYKYLSNKGSVQFIDVWGAILANKLLGNLENTGQNLTFATIRNNLNNTNFYPFPLFSCTIANCKRRYTNFPYHWLEINPYQTYSNELGGSIPTANLGSFFKNGSIKTNSPELSAGFFMGMFGSPFCMSAGDIFNFLLMKFAELLNFQNYKFIEWFQIKFNILKFYKNRFLPAKIANYSFGLKNSALRNTKNLVLIDGGFNFNLPFVPLFRRKSDIIIVCDASSDACIPHYPELQLVANYAREYYNIYFPSIKKPYKKFKNLEIFFDKKDPLSPMIIYFTNPISDSTLKMEYTPEEFEKLHDTMKKIVTTNYTNIAKAIRLKTDQLNS